MSTKISWTHETWNPIAGCSRVSEGCRNCYAEKLSLRMGWSKKPWTNANAKENVILHPERLRKPLKFKPGTRVFVNSMSDLFHPLVPDAYIAQVFEIMAQTPEVTYQILTKRPERAATWAGPWLPNIWQGTSVEDARVKHRIDTLRGCGALTKFLSIEPLIGPMGTLDLTGIDWVIVGGEFGPGYRPMPHEWAREVRDQCVAAGVAFYFKQSAAPVTERGTQLQEIDGSLTTWQQYPVYHAPVAQTQAKLF